MQFTIKINGEPYCITSDEKHAQIVFKTMKESHKDKDVIMECEI